LEGYCSCLKLLNSHALPLSRYPIKPLGYITYFWEFEGVATLALGSQPRQGLVRLWAKKEAKESHLMLLGEQKTVRE
jgi:hypothetical protein